MKAYNVKHLPRDVTHPNGSRTPKHARKGVRKAARAEVVRDDLEAAAEVAFSLRCESDDFQAAVDAALSEGRPDLARRIADAAAGAFYASLAC
mgnify:CR=1 FL=1